MRNTYAENTMGTRIREMRKAAGMSQEQLAEILCTKKATISAYENDHIDIKSSIVLEIAKALNCSGSYLLEGKKAEALDAKIMDALLRVVTRSALVVFGLAQCMHSPAIRLP